MVKPCSVYALLDPPEYKSHLRYIGITCKTIEQRLQEHVNKSRINDNYRCRWIRKLLHYNLKPQVVCLYENLSRSEAEQIEVELIEYFTYLGAKLTNTTRGGGGCLGFKHSKKTRRKISQLKSGKHVGNLNPNFGTINSKEVRRKMAVRRAKKLTPSDVTSIRKKLTQGMKHKDIAKEFNVSRTIVTRIKSGVRYALIGEQ